MIFSKKQEKTLSKALFKNPTNEFRGEPFWSWNNKLDADMLKRQIDCLEEMGIGGFHMHSRTGMNTAYMSEAFLDYVKLCVDYAEEKGMVAYLYDEDRWPSGFAGGLVTKEKKYRARFLVFSPMRQEEITPTVIDDSASRGASSGDGRLLGRYEVVLKDGYLQSYRMLKDGESGENIWYAYLEVAKNSAWYNGQSYVDTLNKEAIEKFVRVTHDPYYEKLKDSIGKNVHSIFTDEPQFTHKQTLGFAEEKRIVCIPYTDNFETLYQAEYKESFLEHLPEIFWELPEGQISVARYHYHDFVAELFSRSFADTVGGWCKAHGLLLTGHMMEEPTLQSQTAALGEAMRSYRSFGLPGIDMLCDSREYSTAKQAQSASHQFGCEGVLSELYGVTGWDFDFRGHKQQGDWQAALGVTNRVHHLSWYSMEGEAKRDYPASIFYQSPWYKEYKLIEDHFARVNTVLTRGKPVVRIGVIHPVESYWLHFGPLEQTNVIREEMENNFKNVIEWLLFDQLDFDFIAESLLPIQYKGQNGKTFDVGEMSYDVLVVPACETMKETTAQCLEKFCDAGGKIIFMGSAPKYINAVASDRGQKLAERCTVIPFTKTSLTAALQPYRELEIKYGSGKTADDLIYQMRQDNDCKWLFVVNGKKQGNQDLTFEREITMKIRGCYKAELYDTVSGDIQEIQSDYADGQTRIVRKFYEQDSLLFKLTETQPYQNTIQVPETHYEQSVFLDGLYAYSLSEPNVVLLEQAEYAFDDSAWQEALDLLLIDDRFRDQLGFPRRQSAVVQPWTIREEEKKANTLHLRFRIQSEIETEDVYFAMERPELCSIAVNDKPLTADACGYYVDESIKKLKIGTLKKGETVITVSMPFGEKTNVEWCYLLGDFGVELKGDKITVTERPDKIPFGNYAEYKLPFYTGNIRYACDLELDEGDYDIQISKFRSPVIQVELDKKDMGYIAFSPYTVSLGRVESGKHELGITLFGNRYNGFGALHNCNDFTSWHGPDAWRTRGESYSKLYQLKKMGALKEPELKKIKK